MSRIMLLSDSSSSEDEKSPGSNKIHPVTLRDVSISQSQNRKPADGASSSSKPACLRPSQKENRSQPYHLPAQPRKRAGSRLTRPPITADTFEVLGSVPDDEPRRESSSSDCSQRYVDLPAHEYSQHPLSRAAQTVPSLEEQLAKHRNGQFEWLLAINFPAESSLDSTVASLSKDCGEVKRVYLGCNLLPPLHEPANTESTEDRVSRTYTLVVTPLKPTEKVLAEFRSPEGEDNMQSMQSGEVEMTPATEVANQVATVSIDDEAGHSTPEPAASTGEDDSFAGPMASSPPEDLRRIEDSFEAIDQLEDQLEAFDEAAHLEHVTSPGQPGAVGRCSARKATTKSPGTVRFATPQPRAKTGAATVRARPATEPRRKSLRMSNSMELSGSPGPEAENPSLGRTPSQKATVRKPASLNPPKPLAHSSKPRTYPTFELPGEAVARQLKEKREARLASQPPAGGATQPTLSSLRRTKSAKPATRPTFELPGEAISRRKRQEQEARLKAQEEEERRRREFKARPIRSGTMPSSTPRGTVSSRARQTKAMAESASATSSQANKRASMTMFANARPPISNANNQPQPRGRGTQADAAAATVPTRVASSSTGSVSGQRSSVSAEDAQQQKLRGHEIYKRDNSFSGDRQREKQEREALAKIAREEAAERSREQSRQWAAKQARKRMTVGSIRDVMA
ncbi:hypothetical protein GGR56DRAFT_359361 [Xylariaceae sp. FL0804]|nr:hypothetical protein GGR56DRAFT_359361 [Xylariaceae sp. FL0804]